MRLTSPSRQPCHTPSSLAWRLAGFDNLSFRRPNGRQSHGVFRFHHHLRRIASVYRTHDLLHNTECIRTRISVGWMGASAHRSCHVEVGPSPSQLRLTEQHPSQRHGSRSSGLRQSIPWIRPHRTSRLWRSWKYRSHLRVPHLVCSARSERREVLSDGSHSVLYLYAHLGRFSCFYLDHWTGQDWNSVHAQLCATGCDDREHRDQTSCTAAEVIPDRNLARHRVLPDLLVVESRLRSRH